MSAISHRFVDSRGLRMHVAEAGAGPLVVLLHGFPECWYSWRHQLVALADAGFHAVAPDQRGYARTEQPERVEDYTLLHLAGDVVGVLDALGEERAVVVGHDWGAPVAWHTALLRPDRVRGVVGMGVPYRPRGSVSPIDAARAALGERFYTAYFQQPGLADAELNRSPRETFLRMLYGASGDVAEMVSLTVPEGKTFLDGWPAPSQYPNWLTSEDIDTYVSECASAGFSGGLRWYRNLRRNWELTAAWHGAKITVPALFMIGARDPLLAVPGTAQAVHDLGGVLPRLLKSVTIPGCGHWCQQERPDVVSSELIAFARAI